MKFFKIKLIELMLQIVFLAIGTPFFLKKNVPEKVIYFF